MKATIFVFLAICVFCTVADIEFGLPKDDISTLIVGGNDAEEGQFPYQVSLRNKVKNRHYCGGSILNSRFLLTSAYCVIEYHVRPEKIYAVVGAVRSVEGGVVLSINKITPHRYFTRHRMRDDIALLRTAEEIVFTNLIQPIALPTQNLPEQDVAVRFSGWGLTKYPRANVPLARPDVLQYSETHTISNKKCADQHGLPPGVVPNPRIVETNICTENSAYSGICLGDAGGPLVDITNPENQTLVGISSWEFTCALGRPDVFTRVYSYVDWINTNIAKQSKDLQ